ncbi:MAG: FAD-dependent oxidoreductase [SAR202 cluster bacterium]|nr:FAD-dependent oxidoreductase [SAR202 cluster bacterium]|tara:strand:- start:2622 stop:5069 length:2448 start_codon:yes stop_codon:yes gene_type:complete
MSLPKHSQVVIIGGGVAGCSTAFHLTELGFKDVVVLERKTITGGTTWHAAGLLTQLRHTKTTIEIAKYGLDLMPELEKKTNHPTGYKKTGSITIAKTKGRMDELNKIASLGRAFNIEVHSISPSEAAKMWPLMETKDLIGALYIPNDAQIHPTLQSLAFAKQAKTNGAKIIENIKVNGIETINQQVSKVLTEYGDIECEYIVNSAGMWANEIGKMCNVKVPLHAAEHMFLVTNQMNMPENLPCLRDPDEQIYFRHDPEQTGSILMGGFEKNAKPLRIADIPNDYHFGLLEPDWDHFKVFWNSATYRVPEMKKAGINRFYVSAESFTPDNNYILGESPEVKNFFVAAGLNSNGIAGGPAVGKITAEWIVNGHPNTDVVDADIKRFSSFSNNKKYLYDRTVENVGTLYGMHWPNLQPETARNIRKSPIHNEIESLGACFGVMSGWERANWFAPKGIKPEYKYSFQKQNWFKYSEKEHVTVRNKAGLFDQSSFAKFLLQGNDSEIVLQRICANQINVPIGKIVYTAMLNSRGGIEADITITKLDQTSFMIVTGPGVSSRDFYWIKNHINKHEHAILTDVTSGYGVLGLMGPKSRKILEKLTPDDVSNEGFPYLTSKKIEIGYGEIIASRVTYVGELGWELYIPSEFMKDIFPIILEEGKSQGMCLAGYHALDSLRLEKSYRSWGHDITYLDTPIEAGLNFAVDMNKNEFIGKKALIEQKKNNSIPKRLAVFILKDSSPLLLGDEPIFRNGELVGIVTSGNYGHSIGKSVGLGYLENESGVDIEFLKNGDFEIQIGLKKYPTDVQFRPPYDPKNEKVKI